MLDLLLMLVLFFQPEPYGGCDEAYLYPHTDGYSWCQMHGQL